MTQKGQTTQIFNHDLRALRRARAIKRYRSGKGEAYLAARSGEIAAEKLTDINRRFKRAVILGLPSFSERVLDALPADKRPEELEIFDHWPDQLPQECDLLISGLILQSRNDVPELMIAARKALRPDGFFLSVFLGGESLLGLRRACFGRDQALQDGVVPRVAPMMDLQQAAALLSLAGLAQPVIDRDRALVSYGSIQTMVEDLRDLGETNCLLAARSHYAGRGFLKELDAHYLERTDTGKIISPYELIWMSGWVPHDSQQKPLKPGSAKMKLSDALKDIRDD